MAKRSSRAGVFWILAILLLAASAAFWWWKTHGNFPAAAVSLSRADYADLPGWDTNDPRPALAAFRRTCAALAKLPAERTMGSYAGTVGDWQGACAALPDSASSASDARSFFEAWFAPVAVGGEGLFTGYYEPELRASRTRHGAYQTPIYGLPADLVSVDLGQFKPELAGMNISKASSSATRWSPIRRAPISTHMAWPRKPCSMPKIPSRCSSSTSRAPAACM